MAQPDLDAPTVSIIIPAYRNPRYVREAVESILHQTFSDFEIIVVDDCSGAEYVEQYDLPDTVRLIRHSQRRGPAAARNTGIRESGGRYIGLLDMDDVWLPDKLETQVRTMESDPAIGIAYCHYTLADEHLQPLGHQPKPQPISGEPFRDLLAKNFIKSCSVVLLRREAIDDCGLFDESVLGVDDWEMWLRIASKYRIYNDPCPRAIYRTHPHQLSGNSGMMRENAIKLRIKWLEWARRERPGWVPSLRFRLGYELQRLSKCQMRDGQAGAGICSLGKAIRACPWDFRAYLHLLSTPFYLRRPAG